MKKISIVISVYNEQGNIVRLLDEIEKYKNSNYSYEIILVDDGSDDGSVEIIKKLCASNKELKLLSFTRNYGHEVAMSAGMDLASGDAVIFMDADLQHPPETVATMIGYWEKGNRIVLTKRIENASNTFTYKVMSHIFYKVLNYLSDYNMQSNTPDFRLIDRYYIEMLKRYKESSRLFRGLLYLIDSKDDTVIIDFIAPERFSGESKYHFIKLFNLAIDSILAFSIKPLRIALIASSVVFVLSIFYGLFLLIYWLTIGVSLDGFMTQVLLIIIFGSANLFVLSVIGEYVGRIHIESKRRPLYTIKELINFNSV